MDQIGMPEGRREKVRDQWRRNETDYLREQRKKVGVSAFRELKVIGHGKDLRFLVDGASTNCPRILVRCIWRCFTCKGEVDRPALRHEAAPQDRHAPEGSGRAC